MQIGTRLLGHAQEGDPVVAGGAGDRPSGAADNAQPPAVPSPPQGGDGTLLALVPIPGTGTSLAIVGYPMDGSGTAPAWKGELGQEGGEGRGGLRLDHQQRRVWVDEREVILTFQEFELLAFLSAHPVTVFTRAELGRRVWQRDFPEASRTVDVHVSRLRRKLGPAYGRYLVTEYRVGYQFRAG